MNVVERKTLLDKLIHSMLTGFYDFSLSAELFQQVPVKEIIQITKNDGEFFDFNFLSHKLCILKEVDPMRGIAHLKTYKIVVDKENYPNNKLLHFEDLDIAITIVPETTKVVCAFKKEFLKKLRFPPTGGEIEVNTSIIVNFNNQYLGALFVAFN